MGADIRLIMAGVGPEETRLRSLAGALGISVTWRGFVDQPDLPRLYAEADAFAFPTLDDPFGVVLIEAAAAGLPLVASPFGGATEDLVRDGVNGFVIDPTADDGHGRSDCALGKRLRAADADGPLLARAHFIAHAGGKRARLRRSSRGGSRGLGVS